MWELFLMLQNQFARDINNRPVRLDLGVFVPVIEARGWDVALACELLTAIEQEVVGGGQ